MRLFYIGLATPCSTVVQVLLCLLYYDKEYVQHNIQYR